MQSDNEFTGEPDLKLRSRLLEHPPKFHFWDGAEKVGGMGPPQLVLMEECLNQSSVRTMLAVETGAGLSTVWLLMLGCILHSFVLDEAVAARIEQFLSEYPKMRGRWTVHIGASEVTLPTWSLTNRHLSPQIALIDGGHGLQTAFVDFVYTNLLLRRGSVLLVDDQQLGAVKLLDKLIVESNDFQRLKSTLKLASYRKRLDRPLLSDWKSQKAIQARLEALL